MLPIRVLSDDLSLLCEIDDYESFYFTKKYSASHNFTLTINRYKNNVEHLEADHYILFYDEDKFRIYRIEYKKLGLTDSGKQSEVFEIVGKCPANIFSNRVCDKNTSDTATDGYDTVSGNSESIMRYFVNTYTIAPTNIKRKVEHLILGTNQNLGIATSYKARYQTVSEVLESLCIGANLGYEIVFDIDTNKMVFQVYSGKDYSTLQLINPPVIFSTEYDNIGIISYIDDKLSIKNAGYVAGQGDEQNRAFCLVEADASTGMNRKELFIDARDLVDNADLSQRGLERLNEKKEQLSIEFEALQNLPFIYGMDYELGDIITVKYPNIATMHTRIIEVTKKYSADGVEIFLGVGKALPDLISVIKAEFKNVLSANGTYG